MHAAVSLAHVLGPQQCAHRLASLAGASLRLLAGLARRAVARSGRGRHRRRGTGATAGRPLVRSRLTHSPPVGTMPRGTNSTMRRNSAPSRISLRYPLVYLMVR